MAAGIEVHGRFMWAIIVRHVSVTRVSKRSRDVQECTCDREGGFEFFKGSLCSLFV